MGIENISETEFDTVEFACPDCGAHISFEACTLLNADDDPDLAQKACEGTLSEFTCPSCGYTTCLEHPCLYLDEDNNIFIYHVVNEDMAKAAIEMFLERYDDVRCRIATSRREFEEKVRIFRTGLDDRGMEILKRGVSGQAKLSGHVPEGEDVEIYFRGITPDNSVDFEVFIGNDAFSSMVDAGGYEMFENAYLRTSEADDVALIVNRSWSEHAIDLIQNEGTLD